MADDVEKTGVFVEGQGATTPLQASPTPPITKQEFLEAREELAARARDAGMRPAQIMFDEFFQQGLNFLRGIVAMVDEGSIKKEKK